MSHFAVAVLSDGTKTLEELLAPYKENNMDDVPREFLEFHDAAEEDREDYETGSREYVKYKGRLYSPYDPVFKKPDASPYGFCDSEYEVPEGLPRVSIPFTTLYPTIEDYLRDWCGYDEVDPETGRYGYWENPNAKWDWYEVGGDGIGGPLRPSVARPCVWETFDSTRRWSEREPKSGGNASATPSNSSS